MNIPGRNSRNMFCLLLGLAAASPAWAVEPRWPDGPYNYLVLDQDLRGVLEQFGRNVNIPIRIDGALESQRLRGKIGGQSAKAFLQWLCDAHRLVWYFDGTTLHILPQNAMQTVYLDMRQVSLEALTQRLATSGFLDERFPLRPTADPAIVSVAAPPAYTGLVRQVLGAIQASEAGAQVAGGSGPSPGHAAPARAEQPMPTVITGTDPQPRSSVGAGEVASPAAAPTADSTADTSPRPAETGGKAKDGGKGKVLVFRGGLSW